MIVIVFKTVGNQLELGCWENVSKEKFCKNNKRKRTLTAAYILDFLRINTKHLPIKSQNRHHIETSQLICITNQLTGFYVMTTMAFYGFKSIKYP